MFAVFKKPSLGKRLLQSQNQLSFQLLFPFSDKKQTHPEPGVVKPDQNPTLNKADQYNDQTQKDIWQKAYNVLSRSGLGKMKNPSSRIPSFIVGGLIASGTKNRKHY